MQTRIDLGAKIPTQNLPARGNSGAWEGKFQPKIYLGTPWNTWAHLGEGIVNQNSPGGRNSSPKFTWEGKFQPKIDLGVLRSGQ